MGKKKKDITPEPEEFHWDHTVPRFMTVRWSPTEEPELDLGSVGVCEALSILRACLEELETRVPEVRLRFNGQPLQLGD